MNDRPAFHKARYVLTFGAVLVIFLLGFTSSLLLEQHRSDVLEQKLEEQLTALSVIQAENALFNSGLFTNCSDLEKLYSLSLERLLRSVSAVESYEQSNQISQEDYQQIRLRYSASQIDFLVMAKKLQSICSLNTSIILYFYTTKDECPQCVDQSTVLNYVRSKNEEKILVFSFDSRIPEIVPVLLRKYNISAYPSLVINDSVYGF